jgi:Leucine-rich repeat (LRR) protein
MPHFPLSQFESWGLVAVTHISIYFYCVCGSNLIWSTGKLPEGATKLLSLESLNLSDTFLEFLPANFGRLTKLRLLELRENQLATLPKSMARLTALKRLDMGQNDLCDLPEVVGSIPSLTELWVDGNKLDVLPEFLGHLQVSFCQLLSLPLSFSLLNRPYINELFLVSC